MFRLKTKTRIKQGNKNLAETSVAIVREKDYRSSPGESPNKQQQQQEPCGGLQSRDATI